MSDHIDIQGLGKWLEDRDITQWDVISADYAFGIDSAEGLEALAKEHGWTVNQSLFAPLGTTDYASYLNQLKGGEGLLVNLSGGDSINFFSQALDFGVLEKYDNVIGNAALTNSSLSAVNDERLVGLYGTANWGNTVDNPSAQAFVEAYREANGKVPADFTGAAYMAMQTLFAGVRAAESVEPVEVARALNGLTFDSIKGEVTMRADDHQLASPMYIGQVIKDGDGFELQIIEEMKIEDTMPNPDPACVMSDI